MQSECRKRRFVDYYYTVEAMALFEGFYANKDGIQDSFGAFWETVSKRFANNPYVIGFDIINEPLPASIYNDPTLLLPHNFD